MIDFDNHKSITIIYDDISYNHALEIFECLKTIIPKDFQIYDYSKYIFYSIDGNKNNLIFINNNINLYDDYDVLDDVVLNICNNEAITAKIFYNDIMIILRKNKLKNIIK